MTTPTLNILDLSQLLFQNNSNKIDNNKANTKSNEFNFAQVWGEIDAAAIALNEQSHTCSSSVAKTVEQNSLTSFIGDITPAVTAVAVAAGLEESPLMDTPYLDSCMSTPFTPSSVFTPNLVQFHNSPYYSPYINNSFNNMNSQQDDIQVASYLKNDFSSWHTPATVTTDLLTTTTPATRNVSPSELFDTFNGEPSQLLLDTTGATSTTVVDESSAFDSLFPPLPSDQQEQPAYQLNANLVINQDLFNTDDFDAANFLDDVFDDCFFNIQDNINTTTTTASVATASVAAAPVLQQQEGKKRKSDCVLRKTTNNKRAKVSASTSDAQFECDICHTIFNRRYNLGTHIKTHDKNRSKDFACHLCLKPFDRKHDLTRHVATVHNGERAYSCNTCPSTFSRKDALVRHQLQKHQIQQQA